MFVPWVSLAFLRFDFGVALNPALSAVKTARKLTANYIRIEVIGIKLPLLVVKCRAEEWESHLLRDDSFDF